MKFLDAFMTGKQLAARGRPLRAPVHKLRGLAKLGVGLLLLSEICCVWAIGGAHSGRVIAAAAAALVLAHVASYLIESRPASLKPRWRRLPVPPA